MNTDRTGLLLVNLGTPDSYRTEDVRRYLRQFLSDPRVLDIPVALRQVLLNAVILPRRPKQSGKAYEQIWTDQGSPLLVYTRALRDKVQQRLDAQGAAVEVGMRYGNPSIESALGSLREQGIDRIVVFPLYPQYSSAATGTALQQVYESAGRLWNTPYLQVIPPFYDHPAFINAFAEIARPLIDTSEVEKVVFSYHGLPERHCRKSDESGQHCLHTSTCCDTIVAANRNCYRAQCFATTRALSSAFHLPEDKALITFQSRLGRDPWIKPYTDVMISKLVASGTRRIAVVTPAFVADCLETIEEIGIRAVEDFKAAGGEQLVRVPCPNDNDSWADAVVTISKEHSSWL